MTHQHPSPALASLIDALRETRALVEKLRTATPFDPMWDQMAEEYDATISGLEAREGCEPACGGCPSWIAPLVSSSLTGGRCWLQTVPMGEGCQMPRLQSMGENHES